MSVFSRKVAKWYLLLPEDDTNPLCMEARAILAAITDRQDDIEQGKVYPEFNIPKPNYDVELAVAKFPSLIIRFWVIDYLATL